MSGRRDGGRKAAETNKKKYGKDFYANIGRKGGKNGRTGGFASEKPGKDGLTGPERAKIAGTKGGKRSKRGPAKNTRAPHIKDEWFTEYKRAPDRGFFLLDLTSLKLNRNANLKVTVCVKRALIIKLLGVELDITIASP